MFVIPNANGGVPSAGRDSFAIVADRQRSHAFPLRIDAPSGWDSNVATLFMIEALIADIVDRRWPETERRIRELEGFVSAQGRLRRNS